MSQKTLKAIAILAGTTIGAGIFGLPYVVSKIGFLPGIIYLFSLAGIVLLLNFAYGEVVLRTPGDHQLTGYAKIYLGKPGRIIAGLALFVSLYGALLAYLIKIGEFLHLIFGFLSATEFSLIFFWLATAAIFFGLKAIGPLEIFLVGLIILFVLFLTLLGSPKISIANLSEINLNLQTLALPYGVILFALAGSTSIPEMEEILRQEPKKLKKAILLGTLVPLLIYLIFILTIVGIAGQATTDDAIGSLVGFLPKGVVGLGAGLGVLAMGTSFLTLGYVLREVWYRDFKFPKLIALVWACLPPLLLFLAGIKDFISILEITGALTGGLTGILILFLYRKAKKTGQRKPAYQLKIPGIIFWILLIVFYLGIFSPLFNLF